MNHILLSINSQIVGGLLFTSTAEKTSLLFEAALYDYVYTILHYYCQTSLCCTVCKSITYKTTFKNELDSMERPHDYIFVDEVKVNLTKRRSGGRNIIG